MPNTLAAMLARAFRTDEQRVLDDHERQSLGGTYARIRDGVVSYTLRGPGDGDLVVLIHGYSAPSFVWEPLIAHLQQQGSATLTFDLFGHGFSDRPRVDYTRDLFARQVEELLHKLAHGRRLHLVGWSMGAMIAARFAADHPQRVASISMLSPSGLPIRMGVLGRTALIPGVGDVGQALIGGLGLRAAQREFFEHADRHTAYMAEYERQLAYQGYRRAMLSALRRMKMDDFRDGYATLSRTGMPVDVLWAARDRATPVTNSELFQRLVPQARILQLPGLGHASFYERPEVVAPLLIRIIRDRGG